MKKGVIVLILFFYSLFCLTVSAQNSAADNSFIEYTGRFDFANPLQPKFSFSGSSIRAMFQGTSIKAILSDSGSSNYYNVIVDGILTKRINLAAASTTYNLVSGLADGVHEIELFKLTESTYGITTFAGFVLDAGKTLVPITTTRSHYIEFIGDSITCGSGNEAASTSVSQSNTNQNHYLSYAAITARNFNARHLSVSKSGAGLFISYTSAIVPNNIESANSMNNYYDRMHWGTSVTPTYDFVKKPDLICVNLGTNDFSKGVLGASFEQAYLNFIDKLQLKSPGVDIIVLLGPMLAVGGYNYRTFKPIMQRVALTANAKNKGNVYFFEMSAIATDEVTGADKHPSLQRHAINAQELTDFIKTIKSSWTLGTIDNEKSHKLNFYPNPTKDIVNTEILANSGDEYILKIVDFSGKIVFNKSYTAPFTGVNPLSILVSDLQSGIYILEIFDKNRLGNASYKFIKE